MSLLSGRRLDELVPMRTTLVVGRERMLAVYHGNDGDGGAVELGLADLMVLEGLARTGAMTVSEVVADVAAELGVEPAPLLATMERLAEGGHLVDPSGRADNADSRAPNHEVATSEVTTTDAIPPADPLDADGVLALVSPVAFRLTPVGFEHQDHDGSNTLILSARELHLAGCFLARVSPAAVVEQLGEEGLEVSLDEVSALAQVLLAEDLLVPATDESGGARDEMAMRQALQRIMRLANAVESAVTAHEEVSDQTKRSDGSERIKVLPVDVTGRAIPLALGMIMGYAEQYQDGALQRDFDFVPKWLTRRADLPKMTARPSVYLYSNYIWTHHRNLWMSEQIKGANPLGVNVHGGPDTPKYAVDTDQYFKVNPHVDVAVRGEGEDAVAAMLTALTEAWDGGADRPDLDVLEGVAGLSYRSSSGRIVHNEDRDRIVDLEAIPSPFLNGYFDSCAEAGVSMGILESNRGCPYGCTFCDWGSATASRIRKFELDRIFAEIEWCGRNKVDRIFLADANFGIFKRDIEIAQKVADTKLEYGSPVLFSTNYAKNTTKHIRQIVETLGEAGILTQGLLSLQSMDPDTLKTVKRSNIKTEKYEDLAQEFRRNKLPLFIDLMLGLPGATPASFSADLQGCVDREVTAKIYPTELLVNSPMNEPGYKSENKIEIDAPPEELVKSVIGADGAPRRALLIATASYTREDYGEMLDLRHAHLVMENLGLMRHVARFVRQEVGLAEVDFYDRVQRDARADPDRWPLLAYAVRAIPFIGAPPGSWKWFIDEVANYLTEELGLVADSALETVLTVQHSLLPSRERVFPQHFELAHDYAAWYSALTDLKDEGQRNWAELVPRLSEFGPAVFTVDDTHEVCTKALGCRIDENAHAAWELDSDVGRAVSHEHLT